MIIGSTGDVRADFWSDLRDSITRRQKLTEPEKRDKVTLRNLTTTTLQFVYATSDGTVSGWYVLNAGQKMDLHIAPGTFYLHAAADQGQLVPFGTPTSTIPASNSRFELSNYDGRTFKVRVNDQEHGTFARENLAQLGFTERKFFQFPSTANIDITNVPQANVKPVTVNEGRPLFEAKFPGGIVTRIARLPNGRWRVTERTVNKEFNETIGASGVLRLVDLATGAIIEIRGNQMFGANKNENLKFAGNGTWFNR